MERTNGCYSWLSGTPNPDRSAIASQATAEHFRSGQAMVEFCVALVVIMVLLAGMIQANRLLRTHSDAMIEARREAAQLAMGALPVISLDARTILDWSTGPDNKPYTADDVPLTSTNTAPQADALTQYAHPSELALFLPLNPVSQLALAGDPIASFALVRGYAEETVPVLPALRNLVYAGDGIPVESEAYLVWTKGLY
ncbi:MAG: pilus assembly protein [Lentisphaerae bacterium]|nr:pilus assembly protein [Lentisphaerota bacterium]